jgi:hypothetical protein
MPNKIKLKIALSVLILLSLASLFSTAAQDKEPTLSETLHWIGDKLQTAAFAKNEAKLNEHGRIIKTMKFSAIRLHDCSIVLRKTVTRDIIWDSFGERLGMRTRQEIQSDGEVSFLLGELDPTKVEIQRELNAKNIPIGYTVTLHGLNDQKKIRYYSLLNKEILMFDEISIPFSEEDMATRMAKALTHAIQLCKGKKEPF